jgi:tetratricopeptide (TPR) repeat protein
MNIFLSYASEQRAVAEEIALALREEGHAAFFDRSTLAEADAYNAGIREAIRDCDLLVFLVSPEAVLQGRYTLTELKFAEEKWPSPVGRVLPVIVRPTNTETIPAYLRAVVILRPGGNVAAEVVAAVARISRPWWMQIIRRYGISLFALAVLGVGVGSWRVYEYRRTCGEASRLAQEAELQQNAGDYAAAWDRYATGLAVCPSSRAAAEGQERLAMDWLDNIRVTEGKETFTDIANKVQPALSRGAVSADDRRAANALAHLGWADFLRSRDGTGGLDPARYYQHAVERDPQNPYAHAMWGHYIVQEGGSVEEAKTHFSTALASGAQRPFVRRLEIAAFMWRHEPDLENEIIRVANDMRVHGEALPPSTKHDSLTWRIWDVYYGRLINGDDKATFLSALPPKDHLATFRWLFPEDVIPKDKRHLYLFMLAQLQERSGDRADARATYQSLLGVLTAQGVDSGRMVDDAREAIKQLHGG